MRVPLRAGSLVFIRPSDIHAIEPSANETLCLTNIAFQSKTYDHMRRRYPAGLWPAAQDGRLPPAWQVGPSRLGLFNRQADELAQAPRERLHIERFLLNLFVELQTGTGHPLPEDAPDWLLRANREIQKPEHFPHGVERFVSLACRSREHVARSARQYLGITPTECVNRSRSDSIRPLRSMGYSRCLARNRISMPDGRISERCNFANLPRGHGRCFTSFRLCSLHQTFVFPTLRCAIALVFRPCGAHHSDTISSL